jgi:hypothetical protein
MKTCSQCKKLKNDDCFTKDRREKDGLRRYCKDCARERFRVYYSQHIAEMAVYRFEHRDERREQSKTYYRQHTLEICSKLRFKLQNLRRFIIFRYGGKCACCGEEREEFLAVDHINGNGNKHRREKGVGSGTAFYRWLRRNNFPEGYQILCHNCNHSFGSYGYCPHLGDKVLADGDLQGEANGHATGAAGPSG